MVRVYRKLHLKGFARCEITVKVNQGHRSSIGHMSLSLSDLQQLFPSFARRDCVQVHLTSLNFGE